MRRKQKTIMEKKNPIDEARRYVDNAKTILKEKGEGFHIANEIIERCSLMKRSEPLL